jgi:hypothetical protein
MAVTQAPSLCPRLAPAPLRPRRFAPGSVGPRSHRKAPASGRGYLRSGTVRRGGGKGHLRRPPANESEVLLGRLLNSNEPHRNGSLLESDRWLIARYGMSPTFPYRQPDGCSAPTDR